MSTLKKLITEIHHRSLWQVLLPSSLIRPMINGGPQHGIL